MGQKLKEQASKAVTSGPISAKARGGSVDDRGEGSPGFAVDQENQGLSEVDPPEQACEGLDHQLHRSAEVRLKCSQPLYDSGSLFRITQRLQLAVDEPALEIRTVTEKNSFYVGPVTGSICERFQHDQVFSTAGS